MTETKAGDGDKTMNGIDGYIGTEDIMNGHVSTSDMENEGRDKDGGVILNDIERDGDTTINGIDGNVATDDIINGDRATSDRDDEG